MQKKNLHTDNGFLIGYQLDRLWDFLRTYAKKCRNSYLIMLNL
jgi:hypothetical protein